MIAAGLEIALAVSRLEETGAALKIAIRPATARSASFRSALFSLEIAISMGLKSGL